MLDMSLLQSLQTSMEQQAQYLNLQAGKQRLHLTHTSCMLLCECGQCLAVTGPALTQLPAMLSISGPESAALEHSTQLHISMISKQRILSVSCIVLETVQGICTAVEAVSRDQAALWLYTQQTLF